MSNDMIRGGLDLLLHFFTFYTLTSKRVKAGAPSRIESNKFETSNRPFGHSQRQKLDNHWQLKLVEQLLVKVCADIWNLSTVRKGYLR